MNIQTVTPPPFEPVTLAEAYAHLRWDTEDEGSPSEVTYPLGDLVTRNITTARQYVEQTTRRAFVKQTLKLVLPGFPAARSYFSTPFRYGLDDDDYYAKPGYVELSRPPYISLVSVKYLDHDDVEQTLDPAKYYVDSESGLAARVYFRDTLDVNIANPDREDSVRITWIAGYAPGADSPSETQENLTANVPAGIKDAILLQVQLLCDRFDANERADIERARDRLLSNFTIARW